MTMSVSQEGDDLQAPPYSEGWARHQRRLVQTWVRERARDASNLMSAIERIRPSSTGGRMPSKAPVGQPPFVHTLLGFDSWKDLVEAPQPDGLGWSSDHERKMWNGWRKAREAGISPERIDELGHEWLREVGAGSKKRVGSNTLSDQSELDLQEKRKSREDKKRERQVHSSGTVTKAEAKRVTEEVVPNLRPADAKKVAAAVLERLDPDALDAIARRVVPTVESATLSELLMEMIARLDEAELEGVLIVAARRVANKHRRRLDKALRKILGSSE